MLKRHMSLLIVIHPSDGDPWCFLIRHAGTGFHLPPLSYPSLSLTSYYITLILLPIQLQWSVNWSIKPGLLAVVISVVLTMLPLIKSALWRDLLGKPWPALSCWARDKTRLLMCCVYCFWLFHLWLALFTVCFTCDFHVNFWSNCIPRYVHFSWVFNLCPLISGM